MRTRTVDHDQLACLLRLSCNLVFNNMNNLHRNIADVGLSRLPSGRWPDGDISQNGACPDSGGRFAVPGWWLLPSALIGLMLWGMIFYTVFGWLSG